MNFNQNTNPQVSTETLNYIHSIEFKKTTMIYTSSHKDKLLNNFKDLLLKYCGIHSYSDDWANVRQPIGILSKKQYYLYLTSGNTESNKNLIYATVTSFRRITRGKPHIIMCETDNSVLLKYLNQLKTNGEIDLDIVSINVQGCSICKIIEKAIQPGKTCLLCVGFVNSVFGSVNHITKIGELAHKHKIPIHVNANHIFGNMKINPYENNIDSFVMDFSNIGGIKNFGILGIKKELLDGYQLDKSVDEFRPTSASNGIEPISLEMANNTISATYTNRKVKMARIKRTYIILLKALKKQYNVMSLLDYLKSKDRNASGGKKILLVLFLQGSTSVATGLYNILSIIPLHLEDLAKKKLISSVNFDKVDKVVQHHYKLIFKDLFKKANSNINLLDNILSLSWNDKMTNAQVNSFVKLLGQVY